MTPARAPSPPAAATVPAAAAVFPMNSRRPTSFLASPVPDLVVLLQQIDNLRAPDRLRVGHAAPAIDAPLLEVFLDHVELDALAPELRQVLVRLRRVTLDAPLAERELVASHDARTMNVTSDRARLRAMRRTLAQRRQSGVIAL
jgi:hypothetical protein